MNRARLESREDAQTWRDRLIGKRIVSANRDIVEHDVWKSSNVEDWEPRVYFCQPLREGFDRDLKFDVQPASPLLRLPAEIRNHILEFVLPPQTDSQPTETEETRQEDSELVNTSAVIFCCKQLYAEGRTLAADLNTFEWEKFPKKTRLCAAGKDKYRFDWEVLNIVCDTKTNVIKQVLYG